MKRLTARAAGERTRKRAKPVQREHLLQSYFIAWARDRARVYPELGNLFAVPNGGHRAMHVARMLYAEGVERGVPDLVLAVPRKPFHGLFIEMKVRPNKPSVEQLEWFEKLRRAGFRVEVCYDDPDEAKRLVCEYLGLTIPF